MKRPSGVWLPVKNGANEEAVQQFLAGKLSFLGIGDVVTEAMERQKDAVCDSLEAILEADAAARAFVRRRAVPAANSRASFFV